MGLVVSSRTCLKGVVSLTCPAPAPRAYFSGHLLPSQPSLTPFHPSCRFLGLELVWCVLGSSLLVWGEVLAGGEGGGMQSHARDASHSPARSPTPIIAFFGNSASFSLTHSFKHRLPHNSLNSYPFPMILGLF